MLLKATQGPLFSSVRLAMSAVIILTAFSAVAAEPKLAPNDVTWLWPAPNSKNDLEQVISIESLKSEDGNPIWSDQQFADVLQAADSDAAKVGGNRIRLPGNVRSKAVWKIAAFRVDPTAPGGHEVIRNNFGERPQLRLILQPVTLDNNQIKVHDIAVHLVYSFLIKEENATTERPDKERFKKIVTDLDALKKYIEDAGVTTSDKPLGVHPGLKSDVTGLREKLEEFLSRHLQVKNLSAMALMGLDGPEPWIFLALSKFPPGADRFGPIPFLPAQMLSFRTGVGIVSPSPSVNNRNEVPNKIPMPKEEKDRRGVSTSLLFGNNGLDLNALAVIGKDENGVKVRDEKLKNRDIADLIADPLRAHFFNTDCLSCHTETRRRMSLSLPFGEFAFLQNGQSPPVDPAVLPQHDWNVRNIGWFTPSPFIGGGPAVPTITQRTANETAEVVDFIDQHYRNNSAPGSQSPKNDDDNQSNASETNSDQSLRRLVYLEQGWTENERQQFYFTGQGSQLVPYSWFVNLELPDSEELFRSNRHMASLGTIPQEPNTDRNPDGLPIGFVKDSNSSDIAMRAGLLGPDFDRNRGLPTSDWLGLTCAACHTSELRTNTAVIRIDGGAAALDLQTFLATLAASMRATATDDAKFARFQTRIRANAGGDIDTSSLQSDLTAYTEVISSLVKRNDSFQRYGLGRLDAFGAILNQICEVGLEIPSNNRPSNAPVSYPFLWDVTRLDWVQWNSAASNPIGRNLGEVLGVFAHAKLTGTPAEGQFSSSARIDYLVRLENQLEKLQAPAWPAEYFGEIDMAKAADGKKLFDAHCAKCHNTRGEDGNFRMTDANEYGKAFIKTTNVPFSNIGTDATMAINFATQTAKPGELAAAVKPLAESSLAPAQLQQIRELCRTIGRPEPDFENEVPRAWLLKVAVAGVLERNLAEQLQNLSQNDKTMIQLEIAGFRTSESPPNGGIGYKARPLNGIWATAPFGHAGAVPTLYQWLLPEDQRVTSFYVGSHEFNPKEIGIDITEFEGAFHFKTRNADGSIIPGNSNKGHSGSGMTDFNDPERWAIIEYIKTLR